MDETELQGDSLSGSTTTTLTPDKIINKPVTQAQRIAELTRQLEKGLGEIADTKTIMVLGFFILTVMVATMLISVLTFFIQSLKEGQQNTPHTYTQHTYNYGQ